MIQLDGILYVRNIIVMKWLKQVRVHFLVKIINGKNLILYFWRFFSIYISISISILFPLSSTFFSLFFLQSLDDEQYVKRQFYRSTLVSLFSKTIKALDGIKISQTGLSQALAIYENFKSYIPSLFFKSFLLLFFFSFFLF